jgi:hypothetical protein
MNSTKRINQGVLSFATEVPRRNLRDGYRHIENDPKKVDLNAKVYPVPMAPMANIDDIRAPRYTSVRRRLPHGQLVESVANR